MARLAKPIGEMDGHGAYTAADDIADGLLWKHLCFVNTDRRRDVIESMHAVLCPKCEIPCAFGLRWMLKTGIQDRGKQNGNQGQKEAYDR